MLICDYNGWADAPEDEREALEALDLQAPLRVERRRRPRMPAAYQAPTRLAA
jgi:hypothetical protein